MATVIFSKQSLNIFVLLQGGPTRNPETPPAKLPEHTMAVAGASLSFLHRMVRQRLNMVQVRF